MDVVVKYNNTAITPVPTVSRSYQFIDYGTRFGQAEQIDLYCYITGLTSNASGNIATMVNTFGGQFKTLEVLDDGNSIYK